MWILCKFVPQPDGSTDKLPVDWRTGHVANAHDPAIWTTREQATASAALYGPSYGVGFVITEGAGYWFIDIDNCLTSTGWTPIVTELCLTLQGAYTEVSQSGRGIHIIGRGVLPPHGCKNRPLGVDLYSKGRFCALTGIHATGGMEADLTPAIQAVAARYFPPGVDAAPADWTDGPCEGYGGPADDDDLIRIACNVTSAAAAFGGRITFRQLWEGDENALAAAYPDDHARPYDYSRADAALAQHLAFWTGKDCARIERIMRQSALARSKWDRADYLPRTILRACGQQREVATGRASPAVPSEPGTPGAPTDGPTLVLASDMARYFEGVVYIEDRYVAAVPDGSLLTQQQFRVSTRYGGRRFFVAPETRPTRNAWEALLESEFYQPPHAHTLCFRPELPPRSVVNENGRLLFNAYVPVVTPVADGDPSPFLRHLELLLPNYRDRSILINYMASLVQNPGVKFQWWPLIQGAEGNGKTLLLSVMSYCVGERYSHTPNAQDLANKFNGWIDQKLFLGIEEIHVSDRRDVLDFLKVLITNARVEIQRKGADQVTGDNRANGILLTNHQDSIPKTNGDRRYCVLWTAQQEFAHLARDGMDGDYFPRLYAWLRDGGYAIVNKWLRSYAVQAELDPAGLCHRAPVTSSTAEAIEVSQGPVEQAILDAVAGGDVGFRGGWVSSHFLRLMLVDRRLTSKAPGNQWNRILAGLGYDRHTALAGGRTNNDVVPDGRKSVLWVKRGSIPALNLTTPTEVERAYGLANNGALGVRAA